MKRGTLSKFNDVDISIDFPDAKMYDDWRGKMGLYNDAMKAIEKCRELDINVSIASVLMSNNHSYFPKFKDILDKYDISLRINLYKSVNGKNFAPSYEQFWSAMSDIVKTLKW